MYNVYMCVFVYTQWNTIPALKMRELLPFAATWMDLESIMLSEISQIKKAKCCIISLICGI